MLTVLIGWYNWKKSIKTTSEIESDFFLGQFFPTNVTVIWDKEYFM